MFSLFLSMCLFGGVDSTNGLIGFSHKGLIEMGPVEDKGDQPKPLIKPFKRSDVSIAVPQLTTIYTWYGDAYEAAEFHKRDILLLVDGTDEEKVYWKRIAEENEMVYTQDCPTENVIKTTPGQCFGTFCTQPTTEIVGVKKSFGRGPHHLMIGYRKTYLKDSIFMQAPSAPLTGFTPVQTTQTVNRIVIDAPEWPEPFVGRQCANGKCR